MASRGRLVAATKRTSARRSRSLPTRGISCSWTTRSSMDWIRGGRSATSSRNRVPPCAQATAPLRPW